MWDLHWAHTPCIGRSLKRWATGKSLSELFNVTVKIFYMTYVAPILFLLKGANLDRGWELQALKPWLLNWVELDRALLRNLLPSFWWGPNCWLSFLSLGHPNSASLYNPCQSLSRVRLFMSPWTVICQVPLPMEFSRQEYWSGLPAGDVELKGWINVQTHVDFLFFNKWMKFLKSSKPPANGEMPSEASAVRWPSKQALEARHREKDRLPGTALLRPLL